MKKLVAALLALVMALSLAACGSKSETKITPATESQAPVTEPQQSAVALFAERNGAMLLSMMEESFAGSSGMTCTSDIKVEGMGFIISININELENIDDATKTLMQETYDAMGDIFTQSLSLFQQDLPTLEYYQVQVCEKDGDLLATITAGNK